MEQLQVAQMHYLKWMMHSPKSTPNALTLLELGVLPIMDEIMVRKLSFLRHILILDESDPVSKMYTELKKYPGEPNWYNEIVKFLLELDLDFDEEKIKRMSKHRWKRIVKRRVTLHALNNLRNQCSQLKKVTNIDQYQKLKRQEYLDKLPPDAARIFFQLKVGIYDLKSFRPFQYDDITCRLCKKGEETLDHVVN